MGKEKVFTNKRLDRLTTKHADKLISFNFRKAPSQVSEDIQDYEFVSTLPVIRITNARTIALNESFPGWQRLLVILMALTQMPDSLLTDIFNMDSEKYKDVNLFENISGINDDDSLRRLYFVLIPEILWTRGNETIESKIPYQK